MVRKNISLKVLLTMVAIAVCQFANGQWIDSFTVTPLNPTTNDTITVLANVSFPSGSCPLDSKNFVVNGQQIVASALHCLGAATFICSTTDTFKIAPLPAGNYSFVFQLSAGTLPAPCTPGIIPGPIDSTTFIVSPATGDFIPSNPDFLLYPNPTTQELYVEMQGVHQYPLFVEIYSLDSKLILRQQIQSSKMAVDVGGLTNGNYIVNVIGKNKVFGPSKVEIIK